MEEHPKIIGEIVAWRIAKFNGEIVEGVQPVEIIIGDETGIRTIHPGDPEWIEEIERCH